MNQNNLLNKKITLNTGTIIIGTLVVLMSIIGALVLGSWLNSPIWPNSQPPIDNNSVLSSSTSSAVPIIENTGTIPADLQTPTPSQDSVTSETPAVSQSETATPSETSQTSTLPPATETYATTPGPGSDPEDWAKLINSSPVDGSYFAPYNTFTYIWTIKNIGTTTWTTDYDLVFISGTKMTNKVVVPFPHNVKPGKMIEISLPHTAPKIPGNYQGFWMLGNKNGETFGIGEKAEQPLKTKITVVNVDPNNSYDFLLNFCQADWWNGQGETIKCPGEPRQISGFVYFSTQPTLENGPSDKPVLWVHSNNILEGIISGRYPAYKVMNGDHFKAKVGCIVGYPKCNVTFKLLYRVGNDSHQSLGTWKELYGGGITTIDVDLSDLAGQSVQFVLRMTSTNNYPASAQGFWMTPRISYIKPTTTPTATATFTPTPTETDVPPEDTPSP